jgi:PKHD-type hydroxylase
MLLTIDNVLTPDEVAEFRRRLADAPWADGRITAGAQSALVKRNAQLPGDCATARELGDALLARLERNPLFITAALPQRIVPPLFNRYDIGMGFGNHIDNAIRGERVRVRTDLSITVFLNAPEEYDGGELVVEDYYGVQRVKGPAGSAVLYPGSSVHRVEPITRGTRYASFFWIQSMVRDDGQRAVLFDLDSAIRRLGADHPSHPSVVQLTGVYHNLLRSWAEV